MSHATRTLREGSTGTAVRHLQRELNRYYGSEVVRVDGDFRGETAAAVEAIQRAHGITEDAIVGPNTRRALQRGQRAQRNPLQLPQPSGVRPGLAVPRRAPRAEPRDLPVRSPSPSQPAAAPAPPSPTAPAAGVTPANEAIRGQVDRAMQALAPMVRTTSSPNALRTAVTAFYNYRAQHPGSNPHLQFVDLGLRRGTPNGHVFNMDTLTRVMGPFNVRGGVGNAAYNRRMGDVMTNFSNKPMRRGEPDANESSLGLSEYATSTFRTSAGGGNNVAILMHGRSGPYNSNNEQRGLFAHGTDYRTSFGCPSVDRRLAPALFDRMRGGVIYTYAPNQGLETHERWASNRADAPAAWANPHPGEAGPAPRRQRTAPRARPRRARRARRG